MKQKEPKKPNGPKKNGLPVSARDYFKAGKRVKGYRRRRAGEGVSEDSTKKR